MGDESSNLSAGNHALCRGRNLPRTSGAKCCGKLEATAGFEHRHHVVDADTFDEPKASRSHIGRALRVVERIGLGGAERSPFPRQLHSVFTVSKLMGAPSPIALRIAVLSGLHPGLNGMVEEHGIDRLNI